MERKQDNLELKTVYKDISTIKRVDNSFKGDKHILHNNYPISVTFKLSKIKHGISFKIA